jgi:hypothetical protein
VFHCSCPPAAVGPGEKHPWRTQSMVNHACCLPPSVSGGGPLGLLSPVASGAPVGLVNTTVSAEGTKQAGLLTLVTVTRTCAPLPENGTVGPAAAVRAPDAHHTAATGEGGGGGVRTGAGVGAVCTVVGAATGGLAVVGGTVALVVGGTVAGVVGGTVTVVVAPVVPGLTTLGWLVLVVPVP